MKPERGERPKAAQPAALDLSQSVRPFRAMEDVATAPAWTMTDPVLGKGTVEVAEGPVHFGGHGRAGGSLEVSAEHCSIELGSGDEVLISDLAEIDTTALSTLVLLAACVGAGAAGGWCVPVAALPWGVCLVISPPAERARACERVDRCYRSLAPPRVVAERRQGTPRYEQAVRRCEWPAAFRALVALRQRTALCRGASGRLTGSADQSHDLVPAVVARRLPRDTRAGPRRRSVGASPTEDPDPEHAWSQVQAL
jgi:hypothetical protein